MTQLVPAVNSNDHVYGNINAKIELVEYGDYQCPYCGRAYPIVKSIQQKMGSDLLFVFRNFPISKIHPQAKLAAIATEAAGLQNKFWEMHDIVFENQKRLDDESIFLYAKTIGLNVERFRFHIQREDIIDKVEQDFYSGMRSGVNMTPSFFINGKKYEGSWEEDKLLPFLQNQVNKSSVLVW